MLKNVLYPHKIENIFCFYCFLWGRGRGSDKNHFFSKASLAFNELLTPKQPLKSDQTLSSN